MVVPTFSQLKRFIGKLLTNNDWDFNFRKIVEWLTDGTADLNVNSVIATTSMVAPLMGDSSTVFTGDGSGISNLSVTGAGVRTKTLANDDFDSWKLGTVFANPASGVETADRWEVDKANGSGTAPSVDVNRVTTIPDSKSTFSMELDVTAAGAIGASMFWRSKQILLNGDWEKFKGESISVAFQAQTPASAFFSIVIDDGVTVQETAFSGTTSFAQYKVENVLLSGVATKLEISIGLANATNIPTTGSYFVTQFQVNSGDVIDAFEPASVALVDANLHVGSDKPLANENKDGLYARSIDQVLRLDEQEIDLATAALIVSEQWSDIVHGRRYLAQLDDMAVEIRSRLKAKKLAADYRAIDVINRYLFDELGFKSVKEATDPNDLFLHSVLDKKKGYCLSLSILYLSLTELICVPF